jgi:hypothetical protein
MNTCPLPCGNKEVPIGATNTELIHASLLEAFNERDRARDDPDNYYVYAVDNIAGGPQPAEVRVVQPSSVMICRDDAFRGPPASW